MNSSGKEEEAFRAQEALTEEGDRGAHKPCASSGRHGKHLYKEDNSRGFLTTNLQDSDTQPSRIDRF